MVKRAETPVAQCFSPLEMSKDKVCVLVCILFWSHVVIGTDKLLQNGISSSHKSKSINFLFRQAVSQDSLNSEIGQEENKRCAYPAYPVDGFVTFSSDDRQVGTTATYSCKEGYVLSGESNRTCLPSGGWSGDIPNCSFSSLKNVRTGSTTSDGIKTKDLHYTKETLNEDPSLESDCQCINGYCVRDGGYVECVCYPEHGKYSFNECKECNCGPGFNCTFDPDIFDDNKKCICTDGYSDVNGTCIGPCTGDPCLNGGTCVNSDGSFYCQCKSGYFGNVCQDKGACADEPCLNGGMCLDINNEYHCICQRGFSGRNCEIGAYVNASTDPDFEISTTPYDFITPNETHPQDCDCGPKSTHCGLSEVGRNVCTCKAGYSQMGNICSDCYCGEQSIGCSFDQAGSKRCLCNTGYAQKDRICRAKCNQHSECLNRGECVWEQADARFCRCEKNFKGDWCEMNTICEKLNPSCMAIGAVCKKIGNSAKCECPLNQAYQWTTSKCEDICDSQKCFNGVCVVDGKNFKCLCKEGYTGLLCDRMTIQSKGTLRFWIPIVVGTNAVTLLLLLGTCICLCRSRRSKQNNV